MIAKVESEDNAISLEPDGSKAWKRISEIQDLIRAEKLDAAIAMIRQWEREREQERIDPHETTDIAIDQMGLPTGVHDALITMECGP